FMEKPFASDPAGVKRVLKAAEAAEKKNLKIGCGLMCRHSSARQALIQKIRDGAMGDILLCRAIRMGPFGYMGRKPANENELLWQIRNRIHVFWSGGGVFHDFSIHLVDECCWIKDAWPVKAEGFGGRVPNSPDCGQNLDAYSIEYTFADGAKAMAYARYSPGTDGAFETFVHGTKCAAQFSGAVHAPTVHMYKDQRTANDNIVWRPDTEKRSPYNVEWDVLLDAIRRDRKHNEATRGAYADLTFLMGRAAVHSGKTITWEQALASNFSICKDIDTLNENSAPPIKADAQGRLPAPVAGVWSEI
ncbi:MAG: gfo/Idh/MocA family oxidoreductase, partial [Planctomycetota bacterium]|nr:gfo/Idh/MocA family oxidoreductase [Planctomycetota bacterium]